MNPSLLDVATMTREDLERLERVIVALRASLAELEALYDRADMRIAGTKKDPPDPSGRRGRSPRTG